MKHPCCFCWRASAIVCACVFHSSLHSDMSSLEGFFTNLPGKNKRDRFHSHGWLASSTGWFVYMFATCFPYDMENITLKLKGFFFYSVRCVRVINAFVYRRFLFSVLFCPLPLRCFHLTLFRWRVNLSASGEDMKYKIHQKSIKTNKNREK